MESGRKLKVFFIVQGEGRGHMTQALAFEELLNSVGHSVVKVMIGKSEQRLIPEFFSDHYKDILSTYSSPNLYHDHADSGVLMRKSFFSNLFKIPEFIKSAKKISREIKRSKPDLIINFHEILTGILYLLFRPKAPIISIAHQYIYTHFRFYYPNMPVLHKLSLELVNKLSTLGSKKKFALNYNQWEDHRWEKLFVMPPLIRNKIKNAKTHKGDYLLVYLLNAGYGADIEKWAKNHPDEKIHVFWEGENKAPIPSLHFHSIDGEKYIEYLSGCKGLVTSAGFESICEAMYLGKPVLAVPVKNHPEQLINANEAVNTRAGMMSYYFDFHDFIFYIDTYTPNLSFQEWINLGYQPYIKEINSLFE